MCAEDDIDCLNSVTDTEVVCAIDDLECISKKEEAEKMALDCANDPSLCEDTTIEEEFTEELLDEDSSTKNKD